MKTAREPFFTKDPQFYKTFFPLVLIITLQNLIAFSVNMADNVMLGNYSQNALSGAATVNQLFFVVQQVVLSFGEALVVLGTQYWGQKRTAPIRRLTGIALKLGLVMSVTAVILCSVIPRQIIMIFTNEVGIIEEAVKYLSLIKYTFVLFAITSILLASLRCVETVKISFYISIVSLFVNVGINYALIFGNFGCPELGIKGAAIGTLVARAVELVIVIIYMWKKDTRLQLFCENFLRPDRALREDYVKVGTPVVLAQALWAISVPMQTAILGHLSSDAIAANSVATTFYQYLKVVVQAMSSASGVMIGTAIGRGDMARIKSDARTLSVIDIVTGLVLGGLLFLLKNPLLSMYNLNESALVMAGDLIVIMSLIMVTMSYQMPVSMGILRGGGDGKFNMIMNIISVWCIVIPLSFASAFWWKWPVTGVVLAIQSDQIFKCIPVFLRFRSYKWVKKLTRPELQKI